jgi:superfamily I DNA/RNA helicase/mRNA-degrading endonuclease RelE of RelBE toxin-antitoxin system
MTSAARVAISRDFLDSLAKLPQQIQKKVRTWTEKFQSNPTSPGIHFEPLQGVQDKKVRSVRIDQAYRAIVIQPPKGDVFLCVWVDHHDEAYQWVRNKRFDINPNSGVLQLYEVQDVEPPPQPKLSPSQVAAPKPPAGLFAAHDDESLLLAGVPRPLLPSVRALMTDEDLDIMRPHLPEDAAETLYGLAAGMSVAEAVAEVGKASSKPVDTEDFAAALEKPTSKRRFKVVEGDSELAAMFDQPLAQWRLFLHPSQQKIVEAKTNGPTRVLGGAGTGKTVVLMHRARHLARKVGDTQKLLVTTYTKNLARELSRSLKALSGNDARRIEVVNLDAWALNFLRRRNMQAEVLSKQSDRKKRMQAAMDQEPGLALPLNFFVEEWDRVIQANEILDEQSYLKTPRKGRGVRLDREKRQQAWKVFAEYRNDLVRSGLLEWPDVLREARLVLERGNAPAPYVAVLADEAQDFSATALRLIRKLAVNGADDIFLVGDGHQRIYGQPVASSACGIEVRGRSHRLRLNYRTTDLIARLGIAVVEGIAVDDLDGGVDSLKGYTSLRRGLAPENHLLKKEADEAQIILDKVRQWLEAGRDPSEICLAARTKPALVSRYKPLLEDAGIRTTVLDADSEEDDAPGSVRLATMHRLKGLEYPCVILASVHDGEMPLRQAIDSDDPATKREALAQERCLLYVACTRARDELVVCGYGKPSPFLK